mmetsp:Transcript_4689/g.17699  ORF Transcript_4689/g.17699 Transcript_4689/m.17699 type:complete len:284 (-) Transcript_4689:1086-1937(-)
MRRGAAQVVKNKSIQEERRLAPTTVERVRQEGRQANGRDGSSSEVCSIEDDQIRSVIIGVVHERATPRVGLLSDLGWTAVRCLRYDHRLACEPVKAKCDAVDAAIDEVEALDGVQKRGISEEAVPVPARGCRVGLWYRCIGEDVAVLLANDRRMDRRQLKRTRVWLDRAADKPRGCFTSPPQTFNTQLAHRAAHRIVPSGGIHVAEGTFDGFSGAIVRCYVQHQAVAIVVVVKSIDDMVKREIASTGICFDVGNDIQCDAVEHNDACATCRVPREALGQRPDE